MRYLGILFPLLTMDHRLQVILLRQDSMLSFSSGKLNNMITTDVDKARRATWSWEFMRCHESSLDSSHDMDVICLISVNPQAQEVSTRVWIRSQVHYQVSLEGIGSPTFPTDGSFMNLQTWTQGAWSAFSCKVAHISQKNDLQALRQIHVLLLTVAGLLSLYVRHLAKTCRKIKIMKLIMHSVGRQNVHFIPFQLQRTGWWWLERDFYFSIS